MVFENLLDPLFSPLLNLHPLLSVTIISLLISLIVVVIYKYTTDQKLMKQLKNEMKEYQKQMKEVKNDPQKMMSINSKAMEANMKYMMQSFKSTLFTLIPVLIIFSWMSAYYAFDPIAPNEQFSLTLSFEKNSLGNVTLIPPNGITVLNDATQQINGDKVNYQLKGDTGIYNGNNSLELDYNNRIFYKDIIITDGHKYASKETLIKGSNLKLISIDYKKKIVLPYLNWGWLGTYILLSIIFSMGLRKLMDVY